MAFPGASLAKAVLNVPVAAADAASSLAAKGVELGTRTTAAGVRTGVRHTSHVTNAFASLASGGRRRRVWAHGGRAHIQANGLAGSGRHHRLYVQALTEALRKLEGVDWAEVNAVTGRVMVSYAEGSVDPADLVSAIEDVEDAHDANQFDHSRHAMPPDDDAAWAGATSALVADCAGAVGAVAGRLLNLAPMPSPVRAAVSVADALPHLRTRLEHHLGRLRADALLGTANALVQGAGQGIAPLAADAAHRAFQLYEIGARRETFRRREPDLAVPGRQPQESAARAERPCPLPDGPVEKAGNRTALGHLLGGAGVLAGTRDVSAAADLLLATVPKAARLGREAFAAVLGHDLAAGGTVVLDPLALRRLDRVDAVVIDSGVLCDGELRLLSAVALTGGMDDADVWRAAGTVLSGCAAGDLAGPGPWPAGRGGAWRLARAADAPSDGPADPRGVTLDLLDDRDRRCGRVRVGSSLDPLAEALLSAAHEAADVVVLTEHASIQELVAWGDDSPVDVGGLAESVRSLQRDGHTVFVISSGQDEALDAADVGVGVLRGRGLGDWRADVVTGPGLAGAWRLLTAVRPARRASDRAAELSLSASALGALLIAGRRPRRRTSGPLRRAAASWQDLPPVHAASLMAMLANGLSARRLEHRPLPPPVVRDAWHALTAEEAVRRLARTARPGEDREPRTGGPLVQRTAVRPGKAVLRLAAAVRQELDDPLTPVLALGAAASAVVGSSVDALLVSSVMAGNALIGGAQRMRAEKALGELMRGQQVRARRLCAGAVEPDASAAEPFAHLRTAPTEQITAGRLHLGDVIQLRSEDLVPADARLLWAESLEVDEATLTGESVPVDKDVEPSPGADPADRHCMLYEGTTVVAGTAIALVVATAEATEAGRAAALAGTSDPSSSMQARLAELTHQALPATLLGGAAVTVLGMLRGLPLRRALGSGVAVAVAAVPEGLPLVATVSQLAAARRLSRLGVLVRSTRALEALGRVDTLCFDKTGTLTEGRLRLVRATGPTRPQSLAGAGEARVLRVAARACPPPGSRQVPHATDRAVLDRAGDLPPDGRWSLDEELPFETTRGFAASLGNDGYRTVIAVKGAPEVLLAKCTRVHTSAHHDEPLNASRRRAAAATVRRLAGQGLRVLAIAERSVPDPGPVRGQVAEHVEDLALLGFIGIADTPRPTAEEAVQRLCAAGVRTTMITGDHPDTAAAVAGQLGIPAADRVVTGAELDAMPAAERIAAVQRAAVFARVSPAQKVRIIKDLRRAGRVVAMTGDGANDAAAIRRADVGIAVVGRGSGAARTAADLVLTAPDTALILDALREGRALWHSVRDAAAILVGGNAGEVSFTVLGTALSGDAPLSTRQLLVVNMLTDMLPALAVAITPAGSGPDSAGEIGGEPVHGFTGRDMRRALAVRGTATAAAALVSWQLGRLTRLVPAGRRRASTMALAALVGAQLGQTLISRWRSPLVMATCAVSAAALFAVVETPGISQFFGCTPLGPGAWLIVTAAAAAATLAAAVAPRLLPSAAPEPAPAC
ncbi:cation-translocating P-type ATPase [Actinomadura violacea]|uniref:Cation-translocating P-type ATPase n=1 Tax=Actinomadura violacea TaxID=2819934 RepID=A0ABS3RT18_9ACTN|nr:cation-translocating P-type ATPase [Actinomadura violacea]MBO2459907.1 cation-translocating P-type ATPase [Actinomadura violacea]